jgi:hypothetical protein
MFDDLKLLRKKVSPIVAMIVLLVLSGCVLAQGLKPVKSLHDLEPCAQGSDHGKADCRVAEGMKPLKSQQDSDPCARSVGQEEVECRQKFVDQKLQGLEGQNFIVWHSLAKSIPTISLVDENFEAVEVFVGAGGERVALALMEAHRSELLYALRIWDVRSNLDGKTIIVYAVPMGAIARQYRSTVDGVDVSFGTIGSYGPESRSEQVWTLRIPDRAPILVKYHEIESKKFDLALFGQ